MGGPAAGSREALAAAAARSRESFWADRYARERDPGLAARRRRARHRGPLALAGALALPALLWHGVIGQIASEFRWDVNYLVSEWTPWLLIALGLAFCVPVAFSAGRDPDGRWYPRARSAYAGWGVTLYLLGLALATQVAQIAEGLSP